MENEVHKTKAKSRIVKPNYHNALGFHFSKFEMDFVDRAIRNSDRFMQRFGKGRAVRDIGADVSFRRNRNYITQHTDYEQKNDN